MNDYHAKLRASLSRNAYMVDYMITSPSPRWVRMPFVSLKTATHIVNNLSNKHFHSAIAGLRHFRQNPDADDFEHFEFSSLRIHSEDELDEMVNAQGKHIEDCDDGDDCEPAGTLRQHLFGDLCQSIADEVSGLSAKELREWEEERYPTWFDLEHLTTREAVMNELRDEYPDGIDWDEYDAEQEQYAA